MWEVLVFDSKFVRRSGDSTHRSKTKKNEQNKVKQRLDGGDHVYGFATTHFAPPLMPSLTNLLHFSVKKLIKLCELVFLYIYNISFKLG